MENRRPLTFEIIVTGLVAIGIACAGCILTGTLWAPLVPDLPLRAARDPSPTTTPTPTVTPSSTFTPESSGERPTPPTPTLIPLPVLDFGTARTVPLIPVPTPTPSLTATPIPAP